MSTVSSFPPALGPAPRALVLGSMPGAASLAAGQYYAHPRNAFWPLMAELFGFPLGPYPERLAALGARGVGLWDVVASCEREGSLDAAIDARTVVVNPILDLLRGAPGLTVVALNGGAAARLFDRHVLPGLSGVHVLRLPSTSPAHAARSYGEKRAAWQALADHLAGGGGG
jgi:TDG/mug DNA glycosylase family protein